MARVDDAEAIACRIREDDEVRIGRVLPRHASGAEADQALDLVGLLRGVLDDEVEMDSWTFLWRGIRSVKRDTRSLTGWRQEDREFVVGIREPDGAVRKDARPERHCSVDVIDTQHDRSESQHTISVDSASKRTQARPSE